MIKTSQIFSRAAFTKFSILRTFRVFPHREVLFREIVRYVNEKNMSEGYPAQEFDPGLKSFEGARVKTRGEKTSFLENDTVISLEAGTPIYTLFDSWPECYLVCLRYYEAIEKQRVKEEEKDLGESEKKLGEEKRALDFVEFGVLDSSKADAIKVVLDKEYNVMSVDGLYQMLSE